MEEKVMKVRMCCCFSISSVKPGYAIPTSPSPEGGFGNDHIDHM
jgi:hypothetical protein